MFHCTVRLLRAAGEASPLHFFILYFSNMLYSRIKIVTILFVDQQSLHERTLKMIGDGCLIQNDVNDTRNVFTVNLFYFFPLSTPSFIAQSPVSTRRRFDVDTTAKQRRVLTGRHKGFTQNVRLLRRMTIIKRPFIISYYIFIL